MHHTTNDTAKLICHYLPVIIFLIGVLFSGESDSSSSTEEDDHEYYISPTNKDGFWKDK